MRGYKRTGQGVSDEQKLLSDSGVRVVADPDRVAGAGAALRDEADITAFILDDGMQHRRAGRDFEMVLIHAREPFGYGRIFPRGLLREPLAGLGRADAFLITHASEVDPGAMEKIVATLNRHKQGAGIFRCDHAVSVDLGGRKYFAFCGIGSPESFFASLGGHCVGTRALDDHHDYEGSELVDLARESQAAGAEVLVTTAKDWVKIEPLGLTLPLPVVRAELSLKFHGTDEEQLLGAIRERLTSPSPRHNP
jgi:tetraacyldisaccharide 4'-kinase